MLEYEITISQSEPASMSELCISNCLLLEPHLEFEKGIILVINCLYLLHRDWSGAPAMIKTIGAL
ncbi:hypothetical protein P3L10_029430 [Capsicum annuum]